MVQLVDFLEETIVSARTIRAGRSRTWQSWLWTKGPCAVGPVSESYTRGVHQKTPCRCHHVLTRKAYTWIKWEDLRRWAKRGVWGTIWNSEQSLRKKATKRKRKRTRQRKKTYRASEIQWLKSSSNVDPGPSAPNGSLWHEDYSPRQFMASNNGSQICICRKSSS